MLQSDFAQLVLAMRTMPDPHHLARICRFLTLPARACDLLPMAQKYFESSVSFFLSHRNSPCLPNPAANAKLPATPIRRSHSFVVFT
jgi:hypothetical protein